VQEHTFNEAIADLQKVTDVSPGSMAFAANLPHAYVISGTRDKAAKTQNHLKNRPAQALSNASAIAIVYVGLDERNRTMACLEQRDAERFSSGYLMGPRIKPLRSDPGFEGLVPRTGILFWIR
jgi:hypothetical protein